MAQRVEIIFSDVKMAFLESSKFRTVTIKYMDLKLEVDNFDKHQIEAKLDSSFRIALESMKKGPSKRKKSVFQKGSSFSKENSLAAEYANMIGQDEIENVKFQIEEQSRDELVVTISFVKERIFNRRWSEKAMAEFSRAQMMNMFALI